MRVDSSFNEALPGASVFFVPRLTGWRVSVWLVALMVMLPLLAVLTALLSPDPEVWAHLKTYVLPELVAHTLLLLAGVGIATALLGTGLGWLTGACDFPGRKFFSWALLLPLALPAYVTGFVFVGLLDFTGPVQTLLRAWFGPELRLPPIRSGGGAVAALTLALYPYVYLLARNAFASQGPRIMEAAQSLGLSRRAAFFRVALPMARPWIAGGLALVAMETLADFGTVAVFNYDTFTTGIYKAWYGLFSLPAAAQLASVLLGVVALILLLERQARAGMRFAPSGRSGQSRRLTLSGPVAWAASMACSLVLASAFLVPVGQLAVWAYRVASRDLDERYFAYLGHSLLAAGLAAGLITAVALLLAYGQRKARDWPTRLAVRLSTLGYALPGAVLAIGIYLPIAAFDNFWIDTLPTSLKIEAGPLLQGTLVAMLGAYLARFLAVAFEPTSAALERITPSLEEAARSLGASGHRLIRRVHVPLLRGGLLSAALLVFVDVMKEMPITLMTRPFGWDTLATRIFEMTSEGEWERAALPGVALVLAGLVPVLALNREAQR